MTLLEIVNKVLRRLRETEVAATTDTAYSQLIADFVADIHQEVMEYDWTSLQHTVEFDLVASQRTYDLARLTGDGGAVLSGRTTNLYSMLLLLATAPQAWIFDDASDDTGDPMILVSREQLEYLYQTDRDQTQDDPFYFALYQSPTQEGFECAIWPLPTEARRIRMRFWTPQTDLDTDTAADDATELLVPWRPVYLGALYLALNERGEEMGEPGGVAENRYIRARGSAIEADSQARGLTGSYEFYVD